MNIITLATVCAAVIFLLVHVRYTNHIGGVNADRDAILVALLAVFAYFIALALGLSLLFPILRAFTK